MPNTMHDRYDAASTTVYLDNFGFAHQGHQALTSLHASMQMSECERRRARARDTDAVWRGDYEHIVDGAMRDRFDDERYYALKISSRCSKRSNLQRDIITKKAIAWQSSSQWLDLREGAAPKSDGTPPGDAALGFFKEALFINDDGEIVSPEFESVMKALSVDTFMPGMDAYVLQHPRMAAMPAFVYDDSVQMRRLVVNVLTPEHFDLIHSKHASTIIEAFVHYFCDVVDGNTVDMRRIWTRAEYWDQVEEERAGGKIWKNRGPKTANPYGRIPVALFGASRPLMSPWCDVNGEMLTENTIEINIAETYLNLLMLQQVKVIGGEFPPGKFRNQTLGIGDVVEFPMGAQSIQVLDFQTDTERFREQFIVAPRREASVACGLNPDEFEAVGPESGEAKKMREHNKVKEALARRVFLRESLVELYWLTVHMLWHALRAPDQAPIHGFERGLTPPYMPGLPIERQPVVFGVDVADYVWPELMDERVKREDRDLEMGMTSLVELYKERNPEVDDDATAETELIKNRSVNRRLGVGMKTPPLPQGIVPAIVPANAMTKPDIKPKMEMHDDEKKPMARRPGGDK